MGCGGGGGKVKHFTSIVYLLLAGVAIFIGAVGNEFRLGGLGRTPTSKPLPIWLGRLYFFGFAGVMLFLGVHSLLR